MIEQRSANSSEMIGISSSQGKNSRDLNIWKKLDWKFKIDMRYHCKAFLQILLFIIRI